jgi:hypothetical protein
MTNDLIELSLGKKSEFFCMIVRHSGRAGSENLKAHPTQEGADVKTILTCFFD